MATEHSPDTARSLPYELPPELVPCVDDLVTEDDTPKDSLFSEKQQRLLIESLYEGKGCREPNGFQAVKIRCFVPSPFGPGLQEHRTTYAAGSFPSRGSGS